ncbi:hypothetical protein SRB5_64410 [Streptomyces sp. RB5]|uniref:Histidine kinase/HSP90-like ATPase domain-containing protein n=1 Tax=Streptomyces smaragdinus TaxID=2585196 RepID=A0A7K0CSA6_9ACTN|nr:ATP-binding protein [Streptomyces smaragdinus]MQY16243.1 hypothetical protein [Streptomyces smaragdinus]
MYVSEQQAGPPVAVCGFYLAPRKAGFVLHMSASKGNLREMRHHLYEVVTAAGLSVETAESAQLVASELVGNAVRACGPWVPVVVQLSLGEGDIQLQVHDPHRDALPMRQELSPDNAEEVSGRGLWILDAVAPGWIVETTPLGKQVTCSLPRQPTS